MHSVGSHACTDEVCSTVTSYVEFQDFRRRREQYNWGSESLSVVKMTVKWTHTPLAFLLYLQLPAKCNFIWRNPIFGVWEIDYNKQKALIGHFWITLIQEKKAQVTLKELTLVQHPALYVVILLFGTNILIVKILSVSDRLL